MKSLRTARTPGGALEYGEGIRDALVREWMEENEYESIEQMKGSVSQIHCENPSEFERTQYMQALTSYLPRQYKSEH